MWCRNCHKEVHVDAAEMAGAACPLCNRSLISGPGQTDSIRHAREILERWQSTDLFERISSTAPLTTLKQQDRAPLLNIPLGSRTILAPASAPSSAAVRSSAAVGKTTAEISSRTDASFWESLIAPPPLLAATAPPLEPLEIGRAHV